MDYQKAYTLKVGVISSAIDEMYKSRVISQESENAMWILKKGLEEAEEMYLSAEK